MKFFKWLKSIFFPEKINYLGTAYDNRYVARSLYSDKPDELIGHLRSSVQDMQSNEIAELIKDLPKDYKIQAIEIAQKHLTPYDLAEIAVNDLTQEGKIEVLEKFQNRLDLEDIYQLFDTITPDQRLNTLKKCVERFESSTLAELIKKYIPLYERLDALNLYHDRIDNSSKAIIIGSLDPDRKVMALKQYGKELNKTDLNDIICSTEKEKVFSVLSVVYNDISSNQIEDIITFYIPEQEKLAALYMCCNRLNSSTISDIIKFSIPEEQKEEALVSLQNRIKRNNVGEIIQFCIKGKDVLKKVKDNLYPEDYEFFSNQDK